MMSDQATTPGNISASMLHEFFSYHGNLMLVGVVSLLLVILFILLLHIFGRRCCFPQLTRNDGNRAATPYPHLFTTFAFVDDANSSNNQKAGLPPFAIASIPIFVYQENIRRLSELLECAICLGSFEDGETGRRLPTCAHPFHVECIDMWLRSNFTCPICRSSAVVLREEDDDEKNTETKQHFPNDSVLAGSDFA